MAINTFGFDQLDAMLDSQLFVQNMKQIFPRAHARIGTKFVGDARKAIIVDKIYKPNALSTIVRKGSSTPLVDKGDLVGSLTYDVKDHLVVELGINSPRLSSGRFLYEVLHNGATIKRGGSTWTIPGRPFLTTVWESDDFVAFIEATYGEALEAVFERSKKSKPKRDR